MKYIVLKLLTGKDFLVPSMSNMHILFPDNLVGVVPVYDDYKEAEEASCNGKYEIIVIEEKS